MRILVPITGELITFQSGNPDNPVKPLNFNKLLPEGLDDFAWEAIEYDFERGVVELEITFVKKRIPTEWGTEGQVTASKPETDEALAKRQAESKNALHKVLRQHTTDELHQMTKEPKLIRPFKT